MVKTGAVRAKCVYTVEEAVADLFSYKLEKNPLKWAPPLQIISTEVVNSLDVLSPPRPGQNCFSSVRS